MIQCRACECRQEPNLRCRRCGKELREVKTTKPDVEMVIRQRDAYREIANVLAGKTDTGMQVEVVQPKDSEPIIPLRFVQRLAIAEAVQRTGNPKKAAKALGIGSTTIYRLLRVYGITTPYKIRKTSK